MNLFWKYGNRFESVLIKYLEAILSKFTVLCLSSYFFQKWKLILFYNRVVDYYTRIFLILIPHTHYIYIYISILVEYERCGSSMNLPTLNDVGGFREFWQNVFYTIIWTFGHCWIIYRSIFSDLRITLVSLFL